MSRREQQDTAFPIPVTQRLDIFSLPPQDDYERAKDKARELLRSIISEKEREELKTKGTITIPGKRGAYVLSPYSQTEIRDKTSSRCMAYACLQLTLPAPTYDRMVAEYLILKNIEDYYWETANIFDRTGNEFGIAVLFLIAFDIALFVNLLLDVLTAAR